MTLGSHQHTVGRDDSRFIPIAPGDIVKPKPGYESLGVPSGKVLSVARFGKHGAIYVEGERRAFVGQCFDVVERTVPVPVPSEASEGAG